MELLEFHVGDRCTCIVGEGDSVTSSDSRVCGVTIDFAASASCEHGGFRGELGEAKVVDDCVGAYALAFSDDEVCDESVFIDLDIRVFADGFADSSFDFPSGFIGVVDDSVA